MPNTSGSFGLGTIMGGVTNQPITATETDVLIVTDFKYLQKTQVTNQLQVALGDFASVVFRYYIASDAGPNPVWHQLAYKTLGTGELLPNITTIDVNSPTSPTTGSDKVTAEDIVQSGAYGFKVTVQGVTGTAGTLKKLTLIGRDN